MLNSSNLAFWCFDLKLFLKKRKKKIANPSFPKVPPLFKFENSTIFGVNEL